MDLALQLPGDRALLRGPVMVWLISKESEAMVLFLLRDAV